MADMRKIVIDVNLKQTANNNGENKAKQIDDSGSVDMDTIFNATGNIGASAIASVFVNQAYRYAKSAVTKSVVYGVDKHIRLTENYKAGESKANAMTAINKVTSLASSVIGGGVAGSTFGPIGAVVGAVIGTVGWGVNEIIDYSQQRDRIELEMAGLSAQTNWNRKRAGLSNLGRGTDN